MFDALFDLIVTLLSFTAVISLVVVIHELGHYWVGRYFGVHAEAFSIGFGPRLAGWIDKNGTDWKISPIPLGGYVRFRGDANAASAPDRETLEKLKNEHEAADTVLHFKPLWQRALIVGAGPFANFILAIALFGMLGTISGEVKTEPRIGVIVENSAADEAGFEIGDLIVSINGKSILGYDELLQTVAIHPNTELDFIVERQGQDVEILATPRRAVREDGLGGERPRGFLGVGLPQDAATTRQSIPIWQAPAYGVERTWDTIDMTAGFMVRLVTGQAPVEMINGPIGIATTAGQVANTALSAQSTDPDVIITSGDRIRALFLSMLALSAIMSVAIGFMNLLPIPVLDGGHLVYYAYEAVTKQPPSPAIQAAGYRLGLALILGIMMVAAWNDISYLRNLFS